MAKNRAVRSVEIRPAIGGWSVSVDFEPEKKDEKGNSDVCCSPWEPSTPMVFTDKADLLSKLGELLEHTKYDEDSGEKSKAKPKAKMYQRKIGGPAS